MQFGIVFVTVVSIYDFPSHEEPKKWGRRKKKEVSFSACADKCNIHSTMSFGMSFQQYMSSQLYIVNQYVEIGWTPFPLVASFWDIADGLLQPLRRTRSAVVTAGRWEQPWPSRQRTSRRFHQRHRWMVQLIC